MTQDDPPAAAEEAQQAIQIGLQAIDRLTLEYAAQLLAVRRRQTPKLGTLFAGHLEAIPPNDAVAKAFRATFNSALVQPNWAEVEPNTGDRRWEVLDAARSTGAPTAASK